MIFRNKYTNEERNCSPTMLDASSVSAQRRRRLFWVGLKVDDGYAAVNIEQPPNKRVFLENIMEQNVDERYFTNTVTPEKMALFAENYEKKKGTRNQFLGNKNPSGKGTNGCVYLAEWKSPTLCAAGTSNNTGYFYVQTEQGPRVRQLTPVECERLQCLPDNFTEKGINDKNEEVKISNLQRSKTTGNGFNCDIITHIYGAMLKEELMPMQRCLFEGIDEEKKVEVSLLSEE